jgi:uncharacterized membrane protein
VAFADILELWKAYGVFEFYLPFVLMFAIFYGLLAKSKIFGDESKERRVRNINVVISIVAALFVMVSPVGVSLTTFFGTFFTQTMVILTTMLAFVLIFYMIIPHGSVDDMLKEPMKYAIYLVPFAVLAVLTIFVSSGALAIFGIKVGGAGGIGVPSLSSQDVVTVVLILVFLLIVIYLTREDKGKGKKIVRFKSVPVYEGEE